MRVRNMFNAFSADDLGTGVFRSLLEQSGNRSTDIKVRITSTHTWQDYGNWSAATTYYKGYERAYPANGLIMWRCLNDGVLSSTPPDQDPTNWEISVAMEFIQSAGDGNYYRTALQMPANCQEPGWQKLKGFEYGSYASSYFMKESSTYEIPASTSYGTSSTSVAIPSVAGEQTILTTQAGLTIPNSTSIGTCTDSFAIPTTRPTTMTRTLPTGLSLVAGDTVTFYGNSTNFFVFVVARYNSGTGVSYGFMTEYAGSGTFSSWTLKTEKLIYWFSLADETNRRSWGVCQSYSGTSLVINNVRAIGSGTFSDWAWHFGKIPNVLTSQDQYFTRVDPLANWFIVEFTGTGVAHQCQTDDRGTKWRYIYADGPDLASSPADVVVDTYSVAFNATGQLPAFRDLSKGTHSAIVVSEAGPSGANTYGWVKATNASGTHTVRGLYDFDQWTRITNIGFNGNPQSHGEVVLIYVDFSFLADDPAVWPFHDRHCENNTLRTYVVDGVTIDASTVDSNDYILKYLPFTSAYVDQAGTFIAETRVGTFATYTSRHTFDRNGLRYRLPVTWARKIQLQQEYVNLVEQDESGFTSVTSENGEVQNRPPNDTTVNMTDTFAYQASYRFNRSDSHALALQFPDVSNWRPGGANHGPNHIQDLADPPAGAKFRPYPSYFATVEAGTTTTYQGRWYLGNRGSL